MKINFLKGLDIEYVNFIKEWYLDRWVDIPLKDLYGAYYDTFIWKIDENIKLEHLINIKNHELFLTYLSTLLRNWELKMKTKEYEEDISARKHNSSTYNCISSKEWSQNEIEEGIEYVRKRWNSFENEEYRKHFEEFWVLFTLPENEWMY